MKLAVFDFDSTLMDGETIDFLAAPLGLEEQVASITERAMAGELDFYKSLRARVALLEGLEEEKVNEICKELPMMPGASDVVAGLKARGYTVVCFSGGFRNATKPACERLGVNADFSLEKLKEFIKKTKTSEIKIIIEVDGLKEEVNAQINPDFDDNEELYKFRQDRDS